MADKLMIHRLQLVVETLGRTELNEPPNQNSILVPKVIKTTNKKKLFLRLWGLV